MQVAKTKGADQLCDALFWHMRKSCFLIDAVHVIFFSDETFSRNISHCNSILTATCMHLFNVASFI